MSKSQVLSKKPIVKAHPETGAIVTYFQSAKGETFGKIRLDQRAPVISNGYLAFANRSAFITMDEDTAKEMEPLLKEDMPYPIDGNIVVRESLTPFYDGQEPKINPSTNEVILHNGQPVYRDTDFVIGADAEDVLLATDRADVPANAETPE